MQRELPARIRSERQGMGHPIHQAVVPVAVQMNLRTAVAAAMILTESRNADGEEKRHPRNGKGKRQEQVLSAIERLAGDKKRPKLFKMTMMTIQAESDQGIVVDGERKATSLDGSTKSISTENSPC